MLHHFRHVGLCEQLAFILMCHPPRFADKDYRPSQEMLQRCQGVKATSSARPLHDRIQEKLGLKMFICSTRLRWLQISELWNGGGPESESY